MGNTMETVASVRRRTSRLAVATVSALVVGVAGLGPIGGGLAEGESVAADGRRNPNVTYRPIADFLQNSPHSFNQVGADIGNVGGDVPMLVSFGWNGYGFPKLDGTASDPSNDEIFGSDPFGFPGGFDSILAEAPHPTRTRGFILQKRLADGGVKIAIRAAITSGPVSIYDVEDTHGVDGVGGCAPACNDLPGGAGEPEAVFGQDANGRFDYVLSIDLTYTAEGVEAAGGDLAAGINPTIPFMIPAFFGFTPGVTVDRYDEVGLITGRVTDNAALAGKFGLSPGKKAAFRWVNTEERSVFDLIR
jgi:hypothetical protein